MITKLEDIELKMDNPFIGRVIKPIICTNRY